MKILLSLSLIVGSLSSNLLLASQDHLGIELQEVSRRHLEIKTLHQLYSRGDIDQFRMNRNDYKKTLNEMNEFGMGVLHIAAMSGQLDWMEALLNAGANIEEPSTRLGWTPYAWALASHNMRACKFLLDRGARAVMPVYFTEFVHE